METISDRKADDAACPVCRAHDRRTWLRRMLAAAAGAGLGQMAQAQDKVDNEMSRYWLRRMAEFRRENPAPGGIVFLGDSMTERFDLARHFGGIVGLDPRQLVNRGIGGDKVGGWRYWGLLDRLDESVLQLKPRQVVLMIGVNDIVFAGTPRDLLHEHTARLFQRLAAAGPAVLVQSVLPVKGRLAPHNEAIEGFNRVLLALARQHAFTWLDMTAAFAVPPAEPRAAAQGAAGELRAELAVDDIHLSAAGYALWARRVGPLLLR